MRLPTFLATLAMLGCGDDEPDPVSDPGGQFGETGTSTPTGPVIPRSGAVWVVAWPPSEPDLETAAMASWTGELDQEVGAALLSVPDQDGDGAEELLIAAPGWEGPLSRGTTSTTPTTEEPASTVRGGRAEVVSSSTFSGAHLFEGAGTALLGRQGSWYSGFGVLGDLDGDGVIEVAVGSDGAVDVSSLTDAGPQPWDTWEAPGSALGYAIVPVPDLDGDGLPEALVSDVASGYGGGQTAGVVALWTGSALLAGDTDPSSSQISGAKDGGALGDPGDLVPVADLTGDGVADVVIAQAGHPVGDLWDAGVVGIYDGAALVGAPDSDLADAAIRIEGNAPCDGVGAIVLPLGDLDGDDLVELAVQGGGGPMEDPADAFHEAGLYVFRGADLDGVVALEDAAFAIPDVGAGQAFPAPDLDGDGLPELVLLTIDGEALLDIHAGASLDLDAGTFTDAPLATLLVPPAQITGLQVAWLADGAGGWRLAVGLPLYAPAR